MKLKTVGLCVLLLALVIACAPSPTPAPPPAPPAEPTATSPPPAPTPTPVPEPTPVSIVLQWLPNVEFAGLWWGIEKGWFAENNIEVAEYLPWAPGIDPNTLVATGRYDFGVNDGAAVIIGRSQGMPIRCVYATFQETPFGFGTLKERPDGRQLTSMEDLRGLRVGYQGHEFYLLEVMLANAGLTLEDIIPVEVGFDPTPLVQGTVDAFLIFRSNEPIALHLAGIETNVISAADYGFDFYGDCLFTSDQMIEEHPEVVRNFVQVFKRGWQYAVEHPLETVDMVIGKYFPPEASDPVARLNHVQHQQGEMILFQLWAQGDLPLEALGSMRAERWQNGIDILANYGVIEAGNAPAPEDVFSNEFLG